VVQAIREAFVSADGTGLTAGGAVTVLGAVCAAALIQRAGSRSVAADALQTQPETGHSGEAGQGAEAELSLV
jgi:hypothetical protein